MQAGMSDVLWNGRDIRDPWLSFELSWSPAGCHNDKGKVISWGIGRPLDKFIFSLAKEISLFISSTSSNDSEYCAPCTDDGFYYWLEWQPAAVSCVVLVARKWETGRTQHGNNQTIMAVSAFIAAYGKDIGKGRVSKEIRLCDRGSFWMLIGQMLQLIMCLMHNLLCIRVKSSWYQAMLTGSWKMTHLYFQRKFILIFQNCNHRFLV